MILGSNARRAAWVACCILAACGGDAVTSGTPDASTPSTSGGGDDAGVGTGDDGGTTVTPPATGDASAPKPKLDGGAPKVIGSPCSLGTDCASGTCDTTVPNGACSKTCAVDADCTEKGNQTGAICLQSNCVELCKAVDAGAPATDGGKPTLPCKNKALSCETVPGASAPVCVYDADASTGDDGGPADDAGPDLDAAGD